MSDVDPIQDTIALDGDGSCIAEARHRALDFLARVQAEYGLGGVRNIGTETGAKDLSALVGG